MAPEPRAPSGSLHRGLTAGGAVRFLAIEAKEITRYTAEAHGLDARAMQTAGEATIAVLLMSAWIKGEERITLQIQAEEPRFAYIGEADVAGNIRARLTPARLQNARDNRITGLLMAIKADQHREVYRGMTPLDGQTIERALVEHLTSSEQVDTLLRLEVSVSDDGSVLSAGGMLLERLPDHPEQPTITPEEFQTAFGALTEQSIGDLHTALAFGSILGHEIQLLENRTLEWRCRCSDEKVRSMLRSLGTQELLSIRDELGKAEVVCHFCNEARTFKATELDAIIQHIERHSSSSAS